MMLVSMMHCVRQYCAVQGVQYGDYAVKNIHDLSITVFTLSL